MRLWTIVLAISLISSAPASAQDIWLAPLSTSNPNTEWGAPDFVQLFSPDADWQTVAQHTAVFKLYPYFVGRASDSELSKAMTDLRRRSISLALEARVLSRTRGCRMRSGDGGEVTLRLLQRIRKLGGEVSYIALDEPLKHALAGPDDCRASIAAAARDAVENVNQFRSLFPRVQVGDIEPIGEWEDAPNLVDAILSWLDAYHEISGEPFRFLHADVGWNRPWRAALRALMTGARNQKVPVGIIYNGDDLSISGREWAETARQHIGAVERDVGIPDFAVFQSWRRFPSRVLPESDPQSLTGIVKAYIER
jgi:hypothetical protein